MPKLTDLERCISTDRSGRRCTRHRLPEHDLCLFHWQSGQRQEASNVTLEDIIGPGQRLNSARAVNAALTRVFRLVAKGILPIGRANSLAYIGQLILQSLPGLRGENDALVKRRIEARGGQPLTLLHDPSLTFPEKVLGAVYIKKLREKGGWDGFQPPPPTEPAQDPAEPPAPQEPVDATARSGEHGQRETPQ